MTTPGMPTGPGPVQVSSKPTGAGTPVTEKVFGLLLTALGVQGAVDASVIRLTTGH